MTKKWHVPLTWIFSSVLRCMWSHCELSVGGQLEISWSLPRVKCNVTASCDHLHHSICSQVYYLCSWSESMRGDKDELREEVKGWWARWGRNLPSHVYASSLLLNIWQWRGPNWTSDTVLTQIWPSSDGRKWESGSHLLFRSTATIILQTVTVIFAKTLRPHWWR